MSPKEKANLTPRELQLERFLAEICEKTDQQADEDFLCAFAEVAPPVCAERSQTTAKISRASQALPRFEAALAIALIILEDFF